ncbi:hypothetical protein CCHOA_04350 [Corynebacterium choanae]|uniref:Uncharacterized protein n=2 Tax=Corynebacterium choanae TaxID=1862358 RepID=A0A3G6J5Q5_9CORY|nr:hypothetical protein CCHOA_04350 [Corynebacterium choanae]
MFSTSMTHHIAARSARGEKPGDPPAAEQAQTVLAQRTVFPLPHFGCDDAKRSLVYLRDRSI